MIDYGQSKVWVRKRRNKNLIQLEFSPEKELNRQFDLNIGYVISLTTALLKQIKREPFSEIMANYPELIKLCKELSKSETERIIEKAVKKFGVPKTHNETLKMTKYLRERLK